MHLSHLIHLIFIPLFQQLVGLSTVAAECVGALAVDGILQMHFLQSGALWHLLLVLFEYDYTLEESGVETDEKSSGQAVANKLAKLAVHAASRLAGLLPAVKPLPDDGVDEANGGLVKSPFAFEMPVEASPKNPVIEESLRAMLTPHIVTRMARQEVKEVRTVLYFRERSFRSFKLACISPKHLGVLMEPPTYLFYNISFSSKRD